MTDAPFGRGDAGQGSAGPSEPTGKRRSTFTPPPPGAPLPADLVDDDAIADALAAEYASYTAPVPIVGAGAAPVAPPSVAPPPAPAAPPPAAPEEPGPVPAADSAESAPGSADPAGDSAPIPTFDPVAFEPPAAVPGEAAPGEAVSAESEPAESADTGSPGGPAPAGPAPAEAVAPADSASALLGASSTLEAIEQLEQGLRLREEDPDAFRAWQETVLAAPGPPAAEPAEEPVDDAIDDATRPRLPSRGQAAPDPVREEPAAPADSADPAGSAGLAGLAPPEFVPPPLVEPPPAAPVSSPVVLPGVESLPPVMPSDGIVPPAPAEAEASAVDFARLPPPLGLEPADLPPYRSPESPEGPSGAEEGLLIGEPPQPVAAETGSAPVAAEHLDEDADVVDDLDRLTGSFAIPVGPDGIAEPVAPPAEPVPVPRAEEEDAPPVVRRLPRAGEVEREGLEPTPLDRRAGRSIRLFWLWFAPNASVVSIAIGAALVALGMSPRQALVAALVGVAISWLPLGFGALAGKWTGQPVMVVSRAMFGHLGNLLPTALAVLTRVFWGGALLWLFAASLAHVARIAGLDAGLGAPLPTLVGLVVGVAVVAAVALLGYGLLARVQLVATILSAILVAGLVVMTAPRLDFRAAVATADGPWTLLVPGAVLVFSVVGLAWAQSTGDLARYQRPEGRGGAVMLASSLGATLPAFALVGWGVLLASSDPALGAALAADPVGALAALLPLWYPVPLLLAVGVGLLSAAILATYSGGFAIQALGLRASRATATLLALLLVAALAAALCFAIADPGVLLRDLVTTIAIPLAAWIGVVAAEMMFRSSRLDAASLLERGRAYPDARWLNLLALVLATAVGFGLSHGELPALAWQGFLFPLLGVSAGGTLATSDLGVLVALLLALVLTLATAYPAVRAQERAVDAARDAAPGRPVDAS